MKIHTALIAAFTVAFLSPAFAQTPQVKGDENKPQTNCPPSDPGNAKRVEDSAILPSAGGHEKSAAPTVQRSDTKEAAVVDPKCSTEPKADPKSEKK